MCSTRSNLGFLPICLLSRVYVVNRLWGYNPPPPNPLPRRHSLWTAPYCACQLEQALHLKIVFFPRCQVKLIILAKSVELFEGQNVHKKIRAYTLLLLELRIVHSLSVMLSTQPQIFFSAAICRTVGQKLEFCSKISNKFYIESQPWGTCKSL